ncbi:MAG: hypothetical protein ACSHX6_07440 [Akkermansiaceae bacterium]
MSRKIVFIVLVVAGVAGYSGYVLGVNKGALVEAEDEVRKEEGMSREFGSETVFEINPYGTMSDAVGRNRMMTRQFFQTQFAIIESEETIGRAIENYDLVSLLGKNKQDLVKEIGGSIKLGEERGTDLIKLSVNADSELKAQRIAYALTHAYAGRRVAALEKRKKEVVELFAKKRKVQEGKVEEARGKLYAWSKKLQIPYYGKDGDLHESINKEENTDNDPLVSKEEKTHFGKLREDYERELAILDAIKQAEFTDIISGGLERDPIVFHRYGWSDEVGAEMGVK